MAGKNKNHIGDNPETTELYDAVSNVGVLRALSLGEWDKWRDCKLGSGTGGGVTIDDVNDLIQQAIEELPVAQDWSLDINTGDATTLSASKAYTDDAIRYIPTYDWGVDIKQGDADTLLNANFQAEQKIKNSEMTQYSIIMHATKTYTDDQLDVAKEYTDVEIAKLPAGTDWQAAIDLGDKNTKQAAEQYTDNQSMWIMAEAGNQISNGLASATIYTDEQVGELRDLMNEQIENGHVSAVAMSRLYTDDEIAAVKTDYNLLANQTLSTSKEYTDVKFKAANKYAEDCAEGASFDAYTYTDNRFANIPLMTPNAIGDSLAKRSSIGTLAASPAQTDADLTTLGQVKTRELDVLNASKTHANNAAGQAWIDSKDYTNQELGNQMNYVNIGDQQTLYEAKSYTDSKNKDWQPTIDAVKTQLTDALTTSNTLLQSAQKKGDEEAVNSSRVVTFYVPKLEGEVDITGKTVVSIYTNEAGSRGVVVLPHPADVQAGQKCTLVSLAGLVNATEFASSTRAKVADDETRPYKFRSAKRVDLTSVVVYPDCYGEFYSDGKEYWHFVALTGHAASQNQSKEGDVPADAPYVYDPVTNTDTPVLKVAAKKDLF